MNYNAGCFDIAVIGAGHAGIEAALACARLGMQTLCFTINLDAIGNMPCNPSIGGTAKGHLVREIDALGGEMAKAADASCIQYRLLNRGKGPAVHSLRAQADRSAYKSYMKSLLERQDNLFLKQDEIVEILTRDHAVSGVKTHVGATYDVKACIICTGTYLNGRIIIGDYSASSGPDGMHAANHLTKNLLALGLKIQRFKTGTPARVNARSINFSACEVQEGEEDVIPFSFDTKASPQNKVCCYLTYTNQDTHRVIKNNLHRSPLYAGNIKGVGPRYCPSIEDKIVRFADKPRHQIFIEPMGLDTQEMYIQGFSSSMPEEIQAEMLHTVKGLENAQVMRSAYAIEYDCIDPLELYSTMECKKISGLYGSGQFCGTSGYEEAAAQGLIAGINAVRKIRGQGSFILDRSDGYIGTLIDDLVTRGAAEPYRMMTSRSEYRLLLRQDNADKRLCKLGYEAGLNSKERLLSVKDKYERVEREIKRLSEISIGPSEEVLEFLNQQGSAPIKSGIKLSDLLKRPEISYKCLETLDGGREELSNEICEQVEISIKYEGYIARQLKDVEQFKKLELKLLPDHINYEEITSLRIEARQKLNLVRPANFGMASRISGVNPADIMALMIYLELRGNK